MPFSIADEQLAALFKSLAHLARLQFLDLVASRGACICSEIVGVLPVSQSTVSRHLKILKEAGLLIGTIDGPRSCYCVDSEALAAFRREMTKRLTNFAVGAEPQNVDRDSNSFFANTGGPPSFLRCTVVCNQHRCTLSHRCSRAFFQWFKQHINWRHDVRLVFRRFLGDGNRWTIDRPVGMVMCRALELLKKTPKSWDTNASPWLPIEQQSLARHTQNQKLSGKLTTQSKSANTLSP